MKYCFSALLSALLFAPISLKANEADGFYFGFGASVIDTDFDRPNDQADDDTRFAGLELSARYQYSPLLGIDTRFGTGPSDETYAIGPGVFAQTELDNFQAIYYRAEHVKPNHKSYLLLGFAHAESTTDFSNSPSVSGSDSSISYGLGFGLTTKSKRWGMSFEWRSLLNTDNADLKTIGIVLERRFFK